MTREEAIEIIRMAISEVEWDYPMDYAAAFDMAIEALKQEPCEDAVSKEAVLGLLEDTNNGWIINEVEQLPYVTPTLPTSADYVSREAVISTIDNYRTHHMGLLDLKKYVSEMPSVTPTRAKRKGVNKCQI